MKYKLLINLPAEEDGDSHVVNLKTYVSQSFLWNATPILRRVLLRDCTGACVIEVSTKKPAFRTTSLTYSKETERFHIGRTEIEICEKGYKAIFEGRCPPRLYLTAKSSRFLL